MVAVSIKTNFSEVQRKLDQLQRDVATQVAARSVNRTVDQAKTQMIRQITADYALKARDVRERLQIKRATFKAGLLGIEAVLSATGRRSSNLIRFTARQVGTGVSFTLKRSSGRKVKAGAFIGNKGRTVFERVPATTMRSRSKSQGVLHRQQIQPVQAIDVPQMFNVRRIKAAVVAAMEQRFPAIFERELAFALSRFGK